MKAINYRDALFYIQTLIKTDLDGLSLDLDWSRYSTKIFADLAFISSQIAQFSNNLSNNHQVINRGELLRELLRANNALAYLIEKCLQTKHDGVEIMLPKISHLRDFQQRCSENYNLIAQNIRNRDMEGDDENTISQQEYIQLLGDDE